jgi:hypothetical protein
MSKHVLPFTIRSVNLSTLHPSFMQVVKLQKLVKHYTDSSFKYQFPDLKTESYFL